MSLTRQIPGEFGEPIDIEVGETPFAELSRLMLVGLDGATDQIVWTAQTVPNGPWSGTLSAIDTGHSYGLLGAGSTLDGRVAMVAQTTGSPASVHFIAETAGQDAAGVQRWDPPQDLGMPDGVDTFRQLVMGRDAAGRVEVFGIESDPGVVWWCYQNPLATETRRETVTPPGTTEPIEVTVQVAVAPATRWSPWIALPAGDVARISLVNDASGRIMLVAVGRNEDATPVYVNAQTSLQALAAGDWSGWERVDDATSGTARSLPCGVLDTTGAVNLFMVSSNGGVVQLRQTLPDQPGWSEWSRPGIAISEPVDVTAGFDGNGLIMLVAETADDGVWANLQVDVPQQLWHGWQKVATTTGPGPAAMDYNSDGRLSYFQENAQSGSVAMITQSALNSTTWSAGWTTIATSEIVSYGIVRDLTPPRA
jgi:hypothetical protein